MVRRLTPTVFIAAVPLGSQHPIVIQSMTNTPTSDVARTVEQIKELKDSGSELVRVTINNDAAMLAIPKIIKQLKAKRCKVPIIGDFHFNGHLLLKKYPLSAQLLSKYRINPGNLGPGKLQDQHFEEIIKIAIAHNKPVRIGVNSGSLDQDLLTALLKKHKKPDKNFIRSIFIKAMVQSALQSAKKAQALGLGKNKIILSVKMSSVQDTITAYELLAKQCDHVLHLGLTEAGSSLKGTISSACALSILLQKGIGDTIRVSLTPQKNLTRSYEVKVAQTILQSLGLRFFSPEIISCPGCGRTQSHDFEILAQETNRYVEKRLPLWKKKYPGIEQFKIAVMGCVVNGPGESKHADIGISLPGSQERPQAVVYAQGKKIKTLTGQTIRSQFFHILENHIHQNY